ncbi:MAG: ASCH domain-containing protein [Candidatus Micrarchaeia archaeon]
MMHEMHLFAEPFDLIAQGKKTIEIRLYDEKRRSISIGDVIIFRKLPDNTEEIKCKVIGLSIFGSFRDLFQAFDASKFGHPKAITIDEQIERMRDVYSEEAEKANGVLGIHIRRI